MDSLLISIDYKDPIWIGIAFLFGLAVRVVNLPPMVGFLIAGFFLHAMGVENGGFLQAIADLGVTLLLFTIGLKLRVGSLLQPEIWATTNIHMASTIAVITVFLTVLGVVGLPMIAELDFTSILIIGFALSFSSTVFAVKTLEDRGTMSSRYGQVAIGVMIMQDIAAVIFLAASTGKLPTIWALGLLLLIPARPILARLMEQTGHQELLTLFGFVMALGGAALFEQVGMKGDLGALVFGVLLAGHPKAKELAKTLMGFKEVFLVCFFLTIGLNGLPTIGTLFIASLFLLLLPLKSAFFFWLFTRFHLRCRSAALGAAVLGNYSEFGLIVAAVAVTAGWLNPEWITVIAIVVSISFVLSAPINVNVDALYARFYSFLKPFESNHYLPGDEPIGLNGARVMVFGMGRVGRSAYDDVKAKFEDRVIGLDLDPMSVERSLKQGRNVVTGDATSPDFWARLQARPSDIDLILLAMPQQASNLRASRFIREFGYNGPIVSVARFDDEEQELLDSGVNTVFNVYAEAGSGAALRMGEFLIDTERDPAQTRASSAVPSE